MNWSRRLLTTMLCLTLSASLLRCAAPTPSAATQSSPTGATSRGPAKVRSVSLSDPIRPEANDEPIVLSAARNEWTSFAVQLSDLPTSSRKVAYTLRIGALSNESSPGVIDAKHFSAAQVLPMPVDANRAGFVRHTGLSASNRSLPRALLPAETKDGVVSLVSIRDTGEAPIFWFDLLIPRDTPAGEYTGQCDVVASGSNDAVASVPIKLTVFDFDLPAERHLTMSGQLAWDDLKRLYPEHFETVTPRLIHRDDAAYAGTVRTLDSLVKLAQAHRTEVVINRLQPTVKWPAGKPPQIDWSDFDSVVAPWLTGDAFTDKVALGYWPLPTVDFLDRYPRESQLLYWTSSAIHFVEKDWLSRSPIAINSPASGRAGTAESIQISADARQLLGVHPHVKIALPLEADQIQLASESNPNFIDPNQVARLITAGQGFVFSSPLQRWPLKIRPQQWLRTDLPGLAPYAGAGGDERDVRVWAWLAFQQRASLVQWASPLPKHSNPTEPADPNDLVWFYPGKWFGVDEPVPSIQLKWLRRAQQDYEYLWLARQRGQGINASLMARLITKPVEIKPGQTADPIYPLLTGTADPNVWSDGRELLAKMIAHGQATTGSALTTGKSDDLSLALLRWLSPQDQALLMGRTTLWGFGVERNNWINVVLGVDIYNASDTRPDLNKLEWETEPRGWEKPQARPIPALATYHVERVPIVARYNLDAVDARDRTPITLKFTNGFTNAESKLQCVLPVAASDRLPPGMNLSDGKLDDWNPADVIQRGPMVRMFDRPALQSQSLGLADEQAVVYTGWSDENLYVAFDLTGAQVNALSARNFVDYQFGRAWGEDLCEILIQPIFDDNSLGPVLHVVCKPAEHWVERKRNPKLYANPWQPFEGTGIRYARTFDANQWRGEVAIPWKAITDRDHALPKLVRFNFSQHVHKTGQSASWAGPIDFGRDDAFMGLLYIRDGSTSGVAAP